MIFTTCSWTWNRFEKHENQQPPLTNNHPRKKCLSSGKLFLCCLLLSVVARFIVVLSADNIWPRLLATSASSSDKKILINPNIYITRQCYFCVCVCSVQCGVHISPSDFKEPSEIHEYPRKNQRNACHKRVC